MRKKFLSAVRSLRLYGIVTSVSEGVFTFTALLCICGIALSRFDVPKPAVAAALYFSMMLSGYISGYGLGCERRCRGLLSGLQSGALLTVILVSFGVLYTRSFLLAALLKISLCTILPSLAGGVAGANKKIYRPPYRAEK